MRQVVRAASTDDARAVLTGVLIASEDDGLKMVATDSYRLAVRDLPQSSMLAAGQKVLVPSRALAELQRIVSTGENLTVRLGAREAVFEAIQGIKAYPSDLNCGDWYFGPGERHNANHAGRVVTINDAGEYELVQDCTEHEDPELADILELETSEGLGG